MLTVECCVVLDVSLLVFLKYFFEEQWKGNEAMGNSKLRSIFIASQRSNTQFAFFKWVVCQITITFTHVVL